MISQALHFTSETLGQFLKNRFQLDEGKTILNNVIEATGLIPQENQNKVVLSLINIEKETAQPFYNRNQQLMGGDFADTAPAERFNLDLLVSANFDDYNETLKFLNATILFFQINNVLDATKSAAIPQGLSKLEFDIEKINYQQMQGLWTAMGAKYQPSVIYKMRLVTIQGDEATGLTPAVKETRNLAEA